MSVWLSIILMFLGSSLPIPACFWKLSLPSENLSSSASSISDSCWIHPASKSSAVSQNSWYHGINTSFVLVLNDCAGRHWSWRIEKSSSPCINVPVVPRLLPWLNHWCILNLSFMKVSWCCQAAILAHGEAAPHYAAVCLCLSYQAFLYKSKQSCRQSGSHVHCLVTWSDLDICVPVQLILQLQWPPCISA